MTFEAELIDYLTKAGYRITKPRAKSMKPLGLNAVGKPYSASYDPNYKMKYRPRKYAF